MTTPIYGSSANRKLVAVTETAWGTTPATPAFIDVPYATLKLNPVLDVHDDTSIYGDRMQRFSVAGNKHIQGELDTNLSPGLYDNLWASVMNASWSSNVLTITNPPVTTSQTLQEIQLDNGFYTTFTGIVVDKVSVTIPASGLVTAKWTLIGKDMTDGNTQITGATVAAATYPEAPFVHDGGVFDFADITLSGSLAQVNDITAFSFDIDNKLTANFTLGYNVTQAITLGDAVVTGTVTFLFETLAHRDAFVANDVVSFSAKLTSTNGTVPKSITFLFPNVTLKTSDRTSAKNGVITETYTWVGNWDSTLQTNVKITRS